MWDNVPSVGVLLLQAAQCKQSGHDNGADWMAAVLDCCLSNLCMTFSVLGGVVQEISQIENSNMWSPASKSSETLISSSCDFFSLFAISAVLVHFLLFLKVSQGTPNLRKIEGKGKGKAS